MGYAARHWPPRRGDYVWDFQREKQGLVSLGNITAVLRDWELDAHSVQVFYKGNHVVWVGWSLCRINGILRHITTTNPDEMVDTIDVPDQFEYYDFDILDGNWSSHVGGDGLWSLG